jgi:L-threonylcarbamoyladenylate synthase
METKVLKIDSEKPEKGKIFEAVRIIDSGGLVAFPTETVYGIACRVQEDLLERLNDVKGRDPNKYYSLHIGRKEEVNRYVPSMGIRVKKLFQEGWPGPITIVFELDDEELEKKRGDFDDDVFRNLYKDGRIGIRCPDNKIASMFLSSVEGAVVAPSANETSQPPAVDAGQVIDSFSGKIEMILDGGACKYKQSSTVVRVKRGNLGILRKGVYSEEQINELSCVQILFVCTGNTCRSPMAEGMFKKKLAEKLSCKVDELGRMGYKVFSAGILDLKGAPASSESVAACACKGIDISSHQSQPLTVELISKSDLIFGLSCEHCARVVSLVPEAGEKCKLLAEGRNIPDPLGKSQQVYQECSDLIEEAVKQRVSEMQI